MEAPQASRAPPAAIKQADSSADPAGASALPSAAQRYQCSVPKGATPVADSSADADENTSSEDDIPGSESAVILPSTPMLPPLTRTPTLEAPTVPVHTTMKTAEVMKHAKSKLAMGFEIKKVQQDNADFGKFLKNAPINESVVEEQGCVIHPNSIRKLCWDLMLVCMLLYVAIVVPMRICFNEQNDPKDFMFWFDVVVDCLFLCDMVLNFRTGYIDEDEGVVLAPKKIAKSYLKGWWVPKPSPSPLLAF